MKLDRKKIALLFVSWLITTNLLVWLAYISHHWAIQSLVLLSISLLPGATIVRILQTGLSSWLIKLIYGFGLSILFLMISGLIVNQLLPLVGLPRPLELFNILGVWNGLVLLCILIGFFSNQKPIFIPITWPKLSKITTFFIVFSFLAPFLAAFGAFRLNNGGDSLVAMIAIGWISILGLYLFIFRKRLSEPTISWGIFIISLAILLMTSLRSWDITGHDIAREFHVYSLTHLSAHWDISAYRDPYNACLSITLLPEIYAKLLNVSGLFVFKVLLQIIFAVCPVVIYLLLRRYTSKLAALVGCGIFISYPTFINDSAMLTRQGVAFLFFSLALFAALQPANKKPAKVLFLLCSVGVILSHYSSSYMFVAFLGAALICKILLHRIAEQKLRLYGDPFSILTPAIVLLVTLMTFLWYTQITATSGGLAATLTSSIKNIPSAFSDDNKSNDTSAALFLAAEKTQIDIYESYLPETTNDNPANDPKYTPNITDDNIPLTPLGKQLSSIGINPQITVTLRQYFAKFLQALAIISVTYAVILIIRKKATALPLDLVCLSIAGIVLSLIMVVLPNLSINYGILRTFQQALIFLIIPMVIFLAAMLRFIPSQLRTTLAASSITLLLLLFSGFFAQLLGGVGAGLTLNNNGLYYGLYYTTKSDLATYNWAKENILDNHEVRSASFAKALMHDPSYPFEATGILPTQKSKEDFVILGQAQKVQQKFYVYHQGSPLITTFPLNYYTNHANQIYSTPSTGVYK